MLVTAAIVQGDQKVVQITWKIAPDDNNVLQDVFPFLWLRYNCQCSKCFHPGTVSRTTSFDSLDVNDAPEKTEVSTDGSLLTVTWQDGHISHYSYQWLSDRRFTESVRQERNKLLAVPFKHWGSELEGHIPTETFSNLMNSDQCLYQWIVAMEARGLFLITDAPKEAGILDKFGQRIAYLKMTNYGKTFQVKTEVDPSNLAFTSVALPLHTDLPYYNYTPGIQMLHCIAQVPTKGGDSYFCDGFYVSEQMKKSNPEAFKILSTTKVDFQDCACDYFPARLLDRKPVIQLNDEGETAQINYNQPKFDSYMNLPADKVDKYLKALKQFDDALNATDKVVNIKLKEGDIICFHNYRVLHARRAFQVLAGGERHLEGGFLDWDEVQSRRRFLEMDNQNKY